MVKIPAVHSRPIISPLDMELSGDGSAGITGDGSAVGAAGTSVGTAVGDEDGSGVSTGAGVSDGAGVSVGDIVAHREGSGVAPSPETDARSMFMKASVPASTVPYAIPNLLIA